MLDTQVLSYFYCFYVLVPRIIFKIRISQTPKMASSTRITRSKGESDGLSLPMKLRSTRRDATSGRNGGTTSTSGQEHQQQMPTQTPHTTQLPETASAEQTVTAPTLPPGPHKPLTPCMPLPASPASSRISSCYIPKYHQNSIPIPKVNNVHFSTNYTNFSRRKLFRPIATRPTDSTTQ